MLNVLRPSKNALAWLLSSVMNSPTAGSGNGACQPPGCRTRWDLPRSAGGLHHAVEGQERLNGELHVNADGPAH